MSRRPGYVFDTNTLVSAFLFRLSIPGRALHAAISGGDLLFSAGTAQEIVEVIRREKFDRYVDRRKREDLLRSLLDDAIIIDIREVIRECRDPDDDKFLALAASARAECIVTGDDDLLVLNPFRDIPIVTPREFLESSPA
ncbi:MAG: putative toxin-antitoxin system toxin component, PIN family [Verrucomicrobiales bacterium]